MRWSSCPNCWERFSHSGCGSSSALLWCLLRSSTVSLATLTYAVLSLTIIRMLPVAVGLAGTGLDTQTVGFIGWFGPRGLASVVFAILAIEQLGEFETVGTAISVVAVTVLLSVLAHGISAGPLVRRYARSHGDGVQGGNSGPRARRRGA